MRFSVHTSSMVRRVIHSFSWSLVSNVMQQGSTFLLNICLARILGGPGFGKFSIVQSTMQTFMQISNLASASTSTKYVAEFRLADKLKAGRIAGLCTVIAFISASLFGLILLLGARWVAEVMFACPELTPAVRIAGIIVFFASTNNLAVGILSGLEEFKAQAVTNICVSPLLILAPALGGYWHGVFGALCGMFIAIPTQWLVLRYVLKRSMRNHGLRIIVREAWHHERSVLFNFIIPAALGGLTTMPALWLANSILVRQSGGAEQMALYTASNSLRLLILFIPSVLNNVGVSILNSYKGSGTRREFLRAYWVNIGIITGTATLLVLLFMALGPYVLMLFGKSFGEGYSIFLVLIWSIIPEALSWAVYQMLLCHGRMWSSFLLVAAPRDLLFVVCAYMLIPGHQAVGLAMSYLISCVFALLLICLLAYGVKDVSLQR